MERPEDLVVAVSDADLAARLSAGDGLAVFATGGDLARTLGTRPPLDRTTVLELPIDLLDVSLDDVDLVACAHVQAFSPWWRGRWLFGPVVAIMNAEFIGEWDVAPRGHPNDGRVEVLECSPSLSVRDRLAVRRRLPLGTHVPHPAITIRSVREVELVFESPLVVWVDGKRRGTSRTLTVRVRPDAAIVYS